MPKDLVQAWEKAGAEVGWMRHYPEGGLIFATESKPDAGVAELPAFSFPRWQAGVLPKLPPPAAPFGLFLGSNPNKATEEGKVADAGLKELAGLKGLRELYLDHTQVTDAGLKELRKALPHCEIRR